MAHKDPAKRRAYNAAWRARHRERTRARHREYMVAWRKSPAGRAAAARRPRKTARRVNWWNFE